MAEDLSFFHLNPNTGSYIASFGPKGTGKSELITRFFHSYPFNGLLIDVARDQDPDHKMTRPLTPELHRLAAQLAGMGDVDEGSLYDFQMRVRRAWTQDGQLRYAKYRYAPSFVHRKWLEETDAYIGLAYLVGHCFVWLDEIGKLAPANRTQRWTTQALEVGRHEKLSMGMAGPRPAKLDPNVLNQADIVTVHGQLHQIDVRRMAEQLHLPTEQLLEIMMQLQVEYRGDVKVCEYMVYEKETKDIFIMDPLPPRSF